MFYYFIAAFNCYVLGYLYYNIKYPASKDIQGFIDSLKDIGESL